MLLFFHKRLCARGLAALHFQQITTRLQRRRIDRKMAAACRCAGAHRTVKVGYRNIGFATGRKILHLQCAAHGVGIQFYGCGIAQKNGVG